MDDIDINRWNTNETLLQSYRTIFITSQSFLLAVGAIILDNSRPLFAIIFSLSIIIIWFFWFSVVRARHLVVDYYKGMAALQTDADKDKIRKICSESEYVHDKEKRGEANNVFPNIKTNWRLTRVKMDLGLPLIFSVVWLSLFAFVMGRVLFLALFLPFILLAAGFSP